MAPLAAKIAPLDKHGPRTPQTVQRAIAIGWIFDRSPAERPAQTGRHGLQVALNPNVECPAVKPCGLVFVDLLEARSDARFNGTLAQDFRAKRMDRSDV